EHANLGRHGPPSIAGWVDMASESLPPRERVPKLRAPNGYSLQDLRSADDLESMMTRRGQTLRRDQNSAGLLRRCLYPAGKRRQRLPRPSLRTRPDGERVSTP